LQALLLQPLQPPQAALLVAALRGHNVRHATTAHSATTA
jgi:hypothetical protein